tara:strand:- start:704 stop:1411 length:708 start_codon:yes stop_codon:yes gene_type:complete
MIVFKNECWALIPARSGSSLKDKNIKKLMGKPLIHFSIDTALKSKCFKKIIFSSDSEKYINLALKKSKYLEIHKRGKATSSDTASEFSVFYDYIKKQKKYLPLYFAHLRPTNPLRNLKTVKKVVNKFYKINKMYTSIRTITEMENPTFRSCMLYNKRVGSVMKKDFNMEKYWIPRQFFPKTYFPSCTIDIYKTKNILKNKSLWGNRIYGYVEKDLVVDIDKKEDFDYAKYILKKK